MKKHGAAFIAQLENRADTVREQFEAIDVIGTRLNFNDCLHQAREIIERAVSE